MLIRKIDEFKCDSCGTCIKICMGDVIREVENIKVPADSTNTSRPKPYIAYPEDCTGCMTCEISCPRQAIEVH
jgi:adenylylsulfate reductase, subunit B